MTDIRERLKLNNGACIKHEEGMKLILEVGLGRIKSYCPDNKTNKENMPYGTCKICGCTDNDPCYNPTHGNCWWVDDTHELCSHCADKKIADDPATQHCINSKGFDPYAGIERKDLAALGCPFPDDDGKMCQECSHISNSSIFTGECDLGIRI